MQRDLVFIALFFALLTDAHVEGKVCPTLDIRNNPNSLEKLRNCTVIMGNLRVVLMENVNDSSVFDDYSFPELTEIVDYLLVYKISRLQSIGRLFPNLRVIRGRTMFWGYSLVIFKMPYLQEIGLTNLQHIGRGAIKVDHCPNVCYVKTIDWTALGASELDFPKTEAADCRDQFCSDECNGYCWSNDKCQRRDTNYCTFFDDGGNCVRTCPKSKVTSYDMMKCLTKKECETMLNGTWWIFNNTCINSCPILYHRNEKIEGGCQYMGEKLYKKECYGEKVVDRSDTLEEMEGCTHIVNGSLEIRISDYSLVPQLEQYLGYITSIDWYLKIGKSEAIRSLYFLKRLKVIKGEVLERNIYSLFISGNENLQRLFNFTDEFQINVLNGTLGFHNNPFLCLSEIKKLGKVRGIKGEADMEISQYSNGYKSSCNQKEMEIIIIENNPTNITMSWQRGAGIDNETVIGYTFYYVEARSGNVSVSDNKGECDADSWNGIFLRENKIQLKNLFPYTRYGYFIKTYTTLSQGEQTPINYFVTASTEPSEPIDFTAEATSDTSILLSWTAPDHLNGPLSHYRIVIYAEKDYLPIIKQRNYCEYPHNIDLIEESKVSTNISLETVNCSCAEKKFVKYVTEDLTCTESGNKLDSCIKTIYHHQSVYLSDTSRTEPVREKGKHHETIELVAVNETNYEFKNLSHFALYIFYLSACNMENHNSDMQCGSSVMVAERTKRRKNADIVKNLRVIIDNNNAQVEWSEPEESNSVLVAYLVEYKKTDSQQSKSITQCITEEEYESNGHEYKIFELTPGKYAIHVQAISLGGPGVFSEWNEFEIISEDSYAYKIYLPFIFVIFLSFVFLGAYFWYRKKRGYYNNHLITSINPDYAGPIYEEDEWEIDRNDIEFIKELGQGSFGMVYQGVIKSKRYPCAIKTVNESASMPSRMEFLNEGSVMKSFNDAHHVIKLLAIVSRGQPPLVIMELMERGDLKSYLRRCREPSQNLTTNELYRMAAEIADGMAYLSAKKFVHRDLAARNCMVAADRTVKIGDFGMARDIYETDYYRKETVGLLPVRWMAPESLADGVFTSDSDVWSYGIVLWEMATFAEQPYQGLSNEEVFHFVKSKGKLDRPNECSDLMYEVMDACWMWRPNDRPTFSDIVNKLVDHVGEDFRLVAFCFSRQGMELALNAGPRVYNPPAMAAAPDDDFFGHYDPSEEEVNLYVKESNRPTKFLPYSSQRMNKSSPYQISPGSPSSTLSFNSS